MNEIDAIGELAQGGLTARAVEPAAGDGAATRGGHTHETACLNCGTPLIGSHCHACGQRGHVHKTLGAFFHDLLHGVLHFEGKIWRTLPMLAWRPGQLTREYIDGRRASYVSPIALFLFTIFLMFAVFSALGADQALLESVDVDTSDFNKQPGIPGSVNVTVSCRLDLSDLAVPGVPGSRVMRATMSSPIDTWRER